LVLQPGQTTVKLVLKDPSIDRAQRGRHERPAFLYNHEPLRWDVDLAGWPPDHILEFAKVPAPFKVKLTDAFRAQIPAGVVAEFEEVPFDPIATSPPLTVERVKEISRRALEIGDTPLRVSLGGTELDESTYLYSLANPETEELVLDGTLEPVETEPRSAGRKSGRGVRASRAGETSQPTTPTAPAVLFCAPAEDFPQITFMTPPPSVVEPRVKTTLNKFVPPDDAEPPPQDHVTVYCLFRNDPYPTILAVHKKTTIREVKRKVARGGNDDVTLLYGGRVLGDGIVIGNLRLVEPVVVLRAVQATEKRIDLRTAAPVKASYARTTQISVFRFADDQKGPLDVKLRPWAKVGAAKVEIAKLRQIGDPGGIVVMRGANTQVGDGVALSELRPPIRFMVPT
jgi:hypothetical protein